MKITKVLWSAKSWEEYLYWQQNNPKTVTKINGLIKDIKRTPFKGIGKPEKLKFKANIWSRRITIEHRLVYLINDNTVAIIQCRYHYD